MKVNQTTKTDLLTYAKNYRANVHKLEYNNADVSPSQIMRANTKERLTALAERRNALLTALEKSNTIQADFEKTVNELCEIIAQISVYKTLLRLSNGAKDISTNGAKKCEEMYFDFVGDMEIYRTHNATKNYSDAMDLFNLAYMTIWEYLSAPNPLALDDTVLTQTLKNGNEKNYTLFQTACKSIRENIRSWSKTDNYKKLHYIIGIADNGKQITTSEKPRDLAGIDSATITAIFNKYGLTAREQEILRLTIDGTDTEQTALLLNLNLRTVQRDLKSAKAKFATANAYAEYCTAKNAEKIAKAKAKKHATDSFYIDLYTKAQERTASAYKEWRDLFRKEYHQNEPTA